MSKATLSKPISEEEKHFISLLADAVSERCPVLSSDDKRTVIKYAYKRGLLQFFGNTKTDGGYGAFEELTEKCIAKCRSRYELLRDVTIRTSQLLENENVDSVVLKGVSLASCYPHDHLRAFSDVDILLKKTSDLLTAETVLKKAGYKKIEDLSHPHHVSFKVSPFDNDNPGNCVTVELHTSPIRPFYNKKDSIIEGIFANAVSEELVFENGTVQVLRNPEKLLHLVLHLLEHYLTAGMGLTMLCDLYVMLSLADDTMLHGYIEYAERIGIKLFSDYLVKILYVYMGLPTKIAEKLCDISKVSGTEIDEISALLKDIIDSGRFGETSRVRMVNLERPGLAGLIRQVDRASCENYPKVSRFVPVRPVLWVMSVIRFIANNKKFGRGKTSEIVKNSKSRGRIAKRMNLWN